MRPVSRPCSAISRSLRCSARATRFVTMKAMIGPMKNRVRSQYVTSFRATWKGVVMRSEPAAAHMTQYQVKPATPMAVRVGALWRMVQNVVLAVVLGDQASIPRVGEQHL